MVFTRELLKQEGAEANGQRRPSIYCRIICDGNLQGVFHIQQCDMQHSCAGIYNLYIMLINVDPLSLCAVHQAFIHARIFCMVAGYTASVTKRFNRTRLVRDASMRCKCALHKQPDY